MTILIHFKRGGSSARDFFLIYFFICCWCICVTCVQCCELCEKYFFNACLKQFSSFALGSRHWIQQCVVVVVGSVLRRNFFSFQSFFLVGVGLVERVRRRHIQPYICVLRTRLARLALARKPDLNMLKIYSCFKYSEEGVAMG